MLQDLFKVNIARWLDIILNFFENMSDRLEDWGGEIGHVRKQKLDRWAGGGAQR